MLPYHVTHNPRVPTDREVLSPNRAIGNRTFALYPHYEHCNGNTGRGGHMSEVDVPVVIPAYNNQIDYVVECIGGYVVEC